MLVKKYLMLLILKWLSLREITNWRQIHLSKRSSRLQYSNWRACRLLLRDDEKLPCMINPPSASSVRDLLIPAPHLSLMVQPLEARSRQGFNGLFRGRSVLIHGAIEWGRWGFCWSGSESSSTHRSWWNICLSFSRWVTINFWHRSHLSFSWFNTCCRFSWGHWSCRFL